VASDLTVARGVMKMRVVVSPLVEVMNGRATWPSLVDV
jgi:hypothetical protein